VGQSRTRNVKLTRKSEEAKRTSRKPPRGSHQQRRKRNRGSSGVKKGREKKPKRDQKQTSPLERKRGAGGEKSPDSAKGVRRGIRTDARARKERSKDGRGGGASYRTSMGQDLRKRRLGRRKKTDLCGLARGGGGHIANSGKGERASFQCPSEKTSPRNIE